MTIAGWLELAEHLEADHDWPETILVCLDSDQARRNHRADHRADHHAEAIRGEGTYRHLEHTH